MTERATLQFVAMGRMNPQDLEWLLAQAKGSPKSLQSDVSELLDAEAEDRPSTNLLLTDPELVSERPRDSSPDDYLRSGAAADGAPLDASRPRGRRGRIDLAAVLYDLAPDCRLAIEPGAGTEVFGNEDQLQRALRLMLLPATAGDISAASSASVEIRREHDWIRVSIELGPDIGVMGDPERRWLHRIAIKHGGKFELRGNTQCLLLPADISTHAEVEALQKELEQAQMLGEAYATELASVLADERAPSANGAADGASIRTLSETLLPILNQAQRELRSAVPASPALIPLGDLLILLTQYASMTATDQNETLDASAVVAAAFDAVAPRAARRGVQLSVTHNPPVALSVAPRTFELLVRCVLEDALCAATEQQSVQVRCEREQNRWVLTVQNQQAPSTAGMHPTVAGVLARSLVAEIGGQLDVATAANGPALSLSLPANNGA